MLTPAVSSFISSGLTTYPAMFLSGEAIDQRVRCHKLLTGNRLKAPTGSPGGWLTHSGDGQTDRKTKAQTTLLHMNDASFDLPSLATRRALIMSV